MTPKGPLVVAVTSRALCDLEEEHSVFAQEGEAGYMAHQRARLAEPVAWGTAYPLVRKLLAFNRPDQPPLVEVCLISRNDPLTGLRVLGTIEAEGLPIEKAIFTKGRAPFSYLQPLGVHLFLSAEAEDVREAVAAGCAAALVMPPPRTGASPAGGDLELRIALDGDCVLFSDEAEKVFQSEGVDAFHAHERARADESLAPGPFAPFLAALCALQGHSAGAGAPRIRTYLVTARAVAAHARALKTLVSWGLTVDEAYFLCGQSKAAFLSAMQPDFFFDDSRRHVDAAKDLVPTGLVPLVLRAGA